PGHDLGEVRPQPCEVRVDVLDEELEDRRLVRRGLGGPLPEERHRLDAADGQRADRRRDLGEQFVRPYRGDPGDYLVEVDEAFHIGRDQAGRNESHGALLTAFDLLRNARYGGPPTSPPGSGGGPDPVVPESPVAARGVPHQLGSGCPTWLGR